MSLKGTIVNSLMGCFFYRHDLPKFTRDEVQTFEAAYTHAINTGTSITYTGLYPKHRLIQYIAQHHSVLLHGSNHHHIQEFEPRRQTLYSGESVEAVFATRDGIWPVFYAVFDRSKLKGNFRNACFVVNESKRFYYFSLTRETLTVNPWTEGTVYFLPDQTFRKSGEGFIAFAEWVSHSPVKPLTQIQVEPNDFLYISQVAGHNGKESIVTSWLFYKLRVWRNKRR
jgi:hypothetical protein